MNQMSSIYLLSTLILLMAGCKNEGTQSGNLHNKESGSQKEALASKYVSGTHITDQLRDDLNAGLDINLPKGHFYTSETIIVNGYAGTVKGAGMDETIIEASGDFKASIDPLFEPEYELTQMFAIEMSKGDVTFKDLTILVVGGAPAELHNNPFHGPSTAIDNAIVVGGTHEEADSGITVTFKNLKIKGKDSDDPGSVNGKNLAYPLIALGSYGAPMQFDVVIINCEIESCGGPAIKCYDVLGGKGIIKNNSIHNCTSGIAAGKFLDTLTTLGELYIMDNTFINMTKYAIGNFGVWSKYCFKNNIEDGDPIPDDCK